MWFPRYGTKRASFDLAQRYQIILIGLSLTRLYLIIIIMYLYYVKSSTLYCARFVAITSLVLRIHECIHDTRISYLWKERLKFDYRRVSLKEITLTVVQNIVKPFFFCRYC